MEALKTFLEFARYPTTALVIIYFIIDLILFIRGISPAILRLGKGLAKRKIAIFANGDDYSSLHSMLIDSKLFKAKNVEKISSRELKKVADSSLIILHWKSAKDHIESILADKSDGAALIIYAPQEEGGLTPVEINQINKHRNVIISNFRGRLLNDVVITLITTAHDKK